MIGAFWCVSCNKVPMPVCSFVNYYFILFYYFFFFVFVVYQEDPIQGLSKQHFCFQIYFLFLYLFFLLCNFLRECKSRQ